MSKLGVTADVEPGAALQREEAEEQPKGEASVLDAVLESMRSAEAPGKAANAPLKTPGLRSARLVSLDKPYARITFRGQTMPIEAEIAAEVEPALLALALQRGDGVLVEVFDGDKPVVVGVIQTQLPREVHIKADEIHLDAAKELVIRAGRAALRLREDGDVELVGTRISASSRGLFRLVGRILRLN